VSSVVVIGKGCRGCRAAAKEHDIVAKKSSADGPVGRWLMNMKISELKLGRLGEAGLEKASLVGGIGGSLLLGAELPGAAKQGRARRARGGGPCASRESRFLEAFVRVVRGGLG
jgi:hypothetical protein